MSSEDQGRDQPKRARIEQHRLDQDRTLLAMHQLEAALSAAAPGREATWRDDVLAHLRRSVRRPPRRPRNAAEPDSLLSDIARTQPWLRNRVRGLKIHYRQLQDALPRCDASSVRPLKRPWTSPTFANALLGSSPACDTSTLGSPTSSTRRTTKASLPTSGRSPESRALSGRNDVERTQSTTSRRTVRGRAAQSRLQVGELSLELSDAGFEDEQSPDPGKGEPFPREPDDPFDVADLLPRISALAALRASGLDHLLGVQPTEERGLYSEHARHLADRVEGHVVVVEWEQWSHLQWPRVHLARAGA